MSRNPYLRLRGLLSSDVTLVGSVAAVNLDGTSDVALIGGGTVTVAGDGFTVSTPVFVKGGRIVSEAPALSVTTIEV